MAIQKQYVTKIVTYRRQLRFNGENEEWELLRQVAQTQKVKGDDGYQRLIRSMFVYEYRDEEGSWFDINPILKDLVELKK